MPPRKRVASTPKTEEPDETTAAATAGDGDAGEAPEPERSDIQTGSEPCTECFPGGWAEQASVVGALGCEHGTWQRNPVD